MATNFDSNENYENPFRSLLQGAAVLAPIGTGAAIGLQHLRSNDAINASDFGLSTPVGRLGSAVGKQLRAADAIQKDRQLKHAREFADKLLKGSGIEEVLGTIQEQNAVIQAVMSALDDPISGLDEGTIQGFKERLLNSMEKVESGADIQEMLGALVNEIYGNNEKGLRVFESRMREFKGLGDQIVAPGFNRSSGTPFTEVGRSAAKGKAAQRLSELEKTLGSGYRAKIVQSTEHTGAIGQYARIYSARGNRFQTMIPLSLDVRSAEQLQGATPSPYNIVRMGDAGTAYRADKYLIDAQAAMNVIAGKKNAALNFAGLRSGNAMVNLEDYFVNNFQQQVQAAGGQMSMLNRNTFNASMREILSVEHRAAGRSGRMGEHLRNLGRTQSNTARLVGLEFLSKKQRLSILEAAARGQDFDLGVGADRLAEQKIGGRISSLLGVKQGSGFSLMRSGLEGIKGFLGLDRFLEPLTGRAEQVTNRISQASIFAASGGRSGGSLLSNLGAGGSNIMWGEQLTGGINKGMLLDVGVGSRGKARGMSAGRIYGGLEGSGQAYHMGRDLVTSTGTIPISDPTAHKGLSTKLLNRIMSGKQGELISLNREEIAGYRGFLGSGPSGSQYLPSDPRLEKLRIGWQNMTDAAGKSTIHMVYEMDRRMETYKLFGRLHKGTVMETGLETMLHEAGQYGVSRSELTSYGPKNLLMGSGEMMKKAPATFMRQMMTGYGMASGDTGWESTVRTQADAIMGGKLTGPGSAELASLARMGGKPGGAVNPVGLMAAAVMKSLHSKNVDPTKAGRVLAAIYNRGMNDTDSWLRGHHSGLQLNSETFENAVKSMWAGSSTAVLDSAAKGLALGADTFSIGEGVGDWRTARGSIEPRFIENLQHKLKSMGLSEGSTSDFVASIYKRKIGYGDHLRTADSMVKMAESIKGLRSVTSELPGSSKPTRVSVAEIAQALNEKSHPNLASYLKTFDQGIIVDLNQHSDVRTQAAMRAAAETAFGGQSEIFLPGGDAMDSMRGTFIKTVSGEPSVAIGSSYERLVERFGRDLQTALGAGKVSSDSFKKVFQNFSEGGMDLLGSTVRGLGSGRIRGSAFMVAQKYDMANGVFLSQHQKKLIASTMQKTSGTALFVDDAGFLSMTKDFMGAGNQYNKAGSKHVNAIKETASKLETFYTGMEGTIGQRKGIASLAARHPILSRGNVAAAQLFRHGARQHGSQDRIFSQIKETAWGKKAIAGFEGDVGSFGAIADSGDHTARKNFFDQFAKNLNEFHTAGGGGRVFMPSADFDVHYGEKSRLKVDFGLASQAIGDFDGDQWSLFMLDKRAGQDIMSTLKDPKDSFLRADTLYKIKSSVYAEEAKSALSRIAQAAPGFDAGTMEYQDALKEKASKEATGILDVHLNEIRRAAQNMSGAADDQVAGALSLLKAMEEHTTIKGKKLPTYHPFAEQLSSAVDVMMRTGDSDPFRRTLHSLYRGSDLLGEGMTIGSIGGADAVNFVHKGVQGSVMRLDAEIDFIAKAANSARSQFTRHATGSSPRQLVSALRGGGQQMMSAFRDLLQSQSSLDAGMVSSGTNNAKQAYSAMGATADRILKAGAKVNRQGLAPVIAGFGVAAVAAYAVGDRGYAPEPLMGPGEMTSPRIQNAIASGQVMNSPASSGPTTDEFTQQQDRYAMMDKPINTNATYMQKPNSYQVGVEAQAPFSYAGAAGYMSSMPGMGSGTSVTINDTRRPITGSYLDRLVGEY